MLRKPVALVIACAFVFALAACGGDDSGSATATTGGSSGSQAPAASDGGSSAGTTAVPDFSGSGSKEFCSQAKGFEDTLGNSDFGQSSDPAQLKKDFANAQDALKKLESSAPNEIKDDVSTVSAALTSLIGVLESANYDFTKLARGPGSARPARELQRPRGHGRQRPRRGVSLAGLRHQLGRHHRRLIRHSGPIRAARAPRRQMSCVQTPRSGRLCTLRRQLDGPRASPCRAVRARQPRRGRGL